ncbi:hypothetical protein BDV37DRAFT_280215 [Aspergillus pseudonomiae]|uniref:Uncharacterized protein n=1 Tax=Aspergillus pseudonomiae TaxID=1506151 RepID=A0A5N7DLK1_9EURO|nr:uncharacterized protein BDV37DRAFT_280215 [Aspergillus pseudonomiae]KAE8407310.1 hypothetical protein BDV37DRAFT_280215 [Aspergillus pseudonomiae]
MEPSPHQWEPTPSSLLWAYEIRRENIHLADEIHKAKADLSSTVDTINDVNQNVKELSRQVKQAETNAIKNLQCLDTRITHGTNNLIRRVEALEIENGRLKAELENVGNECAARSKGLSLVLESMKTEIMNEVRRIFSQEKGSFRVNELLGGSHGNAGKYLPPSWYGSGLLFAMYEVVCTHMARVGSDILVPDSGPKDVTASARERGNSLQALSETTWGPSRSSSIEGRRSTELGLFNGMAMQGQENLHRLFRQNARPLGAYWSYAIDTRIQLPLWMKSSDIAKAFVDGLEDTATRDLMERKLYAAGWSWDVLAEVMHNKLNEKKSQTVKSPVRMKAGSGKPGEASKPNTPIKHKKKRKRRVIPIVPVDEDDLLEMNS